MYSVKIAILSILPILPIAFFFGLLFGFVANSSGLPLVIVASMSLIIFAGASQLVAIILITNNQPILAIVFTVVLVNLRHLLYGAALNNYLSCSKIKRLFLGFFLTDEVFLVSSIIFKNKKFFKIKKK